MLKSSLLALRPLDLLEKLAEDTARETNLSYSSILACLKRHWDGMGDALNLAPLRPDHPDFPLIQAVAKVLKAQQDKLLAPSRTYTVSTPQQAQPKRLLH